MRAFTDGKVEGDEAVKRRQHGCHRLKGYISCLRPTSLPVVNISSTAVGHLILADNRVPLTREIYSLYFVLNLYACPKSLSNTTAHPNAIKQP
jgi:hypothetical protein